MMLSARVVILLLLLIGGWLRMAPASDLQSDVQSVLHEKILRKTTVGISVVRLGTSEDSTTPLYRLEDELPLVPASNLKLITTSAALDRLGPDFRFRTLLLRHGNDLVVIGDGDPTFGDAEFLKKSGWKTTTIFENWAAQLKKRSVTSAADIVVDDSIFEENFIHPHWPGNQLDKRYVAEVAGLALNANCVDFTIFPTAPGQPVRYTLDPATQYLTVRNTCVTGYENAVGLNRDVGANSVLLHGQTPARGTASVSVTIHDPALYAGTVFAETLRSSGMTLTGTVKRDRTLRASLEKDRSGWTVLGIHETPITVVLARANKDSMNLYAESLCKRLGFETAHATGSWENGTAAVSEFLKHVGVPETEHHLDDGSGLSKQNSIAARAIVRVLTYNYFSKNRQPFMDSLAVAGVDGTLDDRFRGSDLRRRVFGKSGFVEGVSSLSGYLRARDGGWYAFSILMNGIPHLSNSEVKLLQEKIIKAVDASTAATASTASQ